MELTLQEISSRLPEQVYIGNVLPSSEGQNVTIANSHFVRSEINTNDRQMNIRFLDRSKKLLVHEASRVFTIDLEAGPDKLGTYTHKTVASGKMSSCFFQAER